MPLLVVPRRLFHNLSQALTLRRVAFAGATLVTLVAGFYIVENWRGERAWAAAQARLRAAGEPATLGEYLPQRPPDDQNFMMNSVFVRRCQWNVEPSGMGERWGLRRGEDHRDAFKPFLAPKTYDFDQNDAEQVLKSWQVYFRESGKFSFTSSARDAASDVLEALSEWEPELNILIEAAKTRPQSYVPLDWTRGLWVNRPHTWVILETLDLCLLKFLALAKQAQLDEALDLLLVSERILDSLTAPPNGIMEVILMNQGSRSHINYLRYSLQFQLYSDTQLSYVNSTLLEKRYIDGFQSAITGEVCSLTDFIEGIVAHERDRKDLISILPIDSNANPSRPLIFNIKSSQLAPRGWLRQNQSAAVALGQSLHHDISAVADALTSPPSQIRDTTTRLHPTNWLAQIHLNEANRTILNCTKDFLAHRSMLRSTIALERHRLAHGAYPSALDQITSFMDERPPYDPFSAKSLQYTNVQGTPRLWSLGRNHTDEGGIPPEKKQGTAGQITSLVNDIVWILPAK